MKHRRPRFINIRTSVFILCFLIILQLFVLKELQYSTSLLEKVSPEEALRQPGPNFSIGSLDWDVEFYVKDPKLEPFRMYFRKACGEKKGVAAALCLSDRFAKEIPWGEPFNEFFYPGHDPVKEFHRHIRGEQGHCVTRSGYIATILLSVGIPARVVQLVPLDTYGHNLVEVWDKRHGWVMTDPSYNGLIGSGEDPSSAVSMWRSPGSVKWLGKGLSNASPAGNPLEIYKKNCYLFEGYLVYPEPWLYLRTGRRVSYWPFWGRFAVIGPWHWSLGPAQGFLRIGILFCAFGLLLLSLKPLTTLIKRVKKSILK